MFKGVMSSIDFDLYGGDDRDRGYRIEVVENPDDQQNAARLRLPAIHRPPAEHGAGQRTDAVPAGHESHDPLRNE